MKVLVIDIGGTNAKLWIEGLESPVKIPSGKDLTPKKLFDEAEEVVKDWEFDRISIGYPGEIVHGRPVKDPWNLGKGWVDFPWDETFGHPVRMMNDACMQALGGYEGGKMLYLGLGTSVGTTLILDGKIIPLALGHLLCEKSRSFEESLSRAALKNLGEKEWGRLARHAATVLKDAFLVDYVMFGGGNAKKLTKLPDFARRGSNLHAYLGGLRMWEDSKERPAVGVKAETEVA
jgi:predicted NBD/HSP70 family sugar kinase